MALGFFFPFLFLFTASVFLKIIWGLVGLISAKEEKLGAPHLGPCHRPIMALCFLALYGLGRHPQVPHPRSAARPPPGKADW